jgi:hypothetical protein
MSWKTRVKTKINIPRDVFFRTNFKINLYFKQRFAREFLLHATGLRATNTTDVALGNYVAMYRDRMDTIRNARLTDAEGWITRRLCNRDDEEEVRARSKELLTDEIVANPMAGGTSRAMVTKVVADLLRSRPGQVRSACNIGAFVDTQSAYLAPRFPNVEFTSVDRYVDLDKINSFLPQSPNWKFRSGYALDLLQTGSLAADLFFMTSTSVCFSPRELEAYIAAFTKSCRFAVFNEPWWPSLQSLNLFKIPRPEEIRPGDALLGLVYFKFQSNYIYYLEQHGFDVLMSQIVPTAGASWYTLQIIAERRVGGSRS